MTFENTNLVENFLNYWRITGHQRIGFLYGTYEIYSDVPLGNNLLLEINKIMLHIIQRHHNYSITFYSVRLMWTTLSYRQI